MRIFLALSAVFLLAATPVDAAAMRAQPVYKVDRVSASVEGRKLIVSASGAVNTGGWENPRLRVRPHTPESATLVIDFIATPPAKDAVVIQALVPVTATLITALPPYGTTEIKIQAETNSVTAPYKSANSN